MNKQVSKAHYDFSRYIGRDRWSSYYYQIREVLRLHPETLLEIGGGGGVLKNYIVSQTHIAYQSLDVAEDLHPDIVGSADEIPLSSGSIDCIVCFEVLEHLPFEKFPKALGEIARVTKKDVVLSLPHFGPPLKFLIKIPFLPEISFAWKVPFRKEHEWNGEHYWEVGKKGYSPQRIRAEIEKYFLITKEFIPFENQYHHFFVLQKKI